MDLLWRNGNVREKGLRVGVVVTLRVVQRDCPLVGKEDFPEVS